MALTRVSGDLIGQNTVTNQNIAASVQDAYGWRNRIINGDMRIDQRNNGASITVSGSSGGYPVDRFLFQQEADSVITLQQDSDAPVGFTKSLKLTVATPDASIGASQYVLFSHRFEGFNVADLGWGTATAQTVTVSFWVKSSITGQYPVRLINANGSRSYPFYVNIADANTWEYKTQTIVGPTNGTFSTNNTYSFGLDVSLGLGSNFVGGTPNIWNTTTSFAASNLTNNTGWIATSGATLYITGVQLEAGSVATAFERRDFGRELLMCQRYLPAYVGISNIICNGSGFDANNTRLRVSFPVQVRAPATGIVVSSAAHFSIQSGVGSLTACGSLSFGASGVNGASIGANHSGGGATNAGTALIGNNVSAVLFFTGCEL